MLLLHEILIWYWLVLYMLYNISLTHWVFKWGMFWGFSCKFMQIEVFDPFSILGLEPGAPESEIKKKYRRLSIQYHPDKNPDPGWMCFCCLINISHCCQLWCLQQIGLSAITHVTDVVFFLIVFVSEAHKYFVEHIAKAYQALTDPIARENYEKYGHPDGRQVIKLKCHKSDLWLVAFFCLY